VYDLDLDTMTLVLDFDLHIMKMYLHNIIKFVSQGIQKLRYEPNRTDRRTDRQTQLNTLTCHTCEW